VRVRSVTARKGGVTAGTVHKGRVRPVTVRKYIGKEKRTGGRRAGRKGLRIHGRGLQVRKCTGKAERVRKESGRTL
jgi:hypothetical protein